MDDLGVGGASENLLELVGPFTHDQPQLVGVVIRQATGDFLARAVTHEHNVAAVKPAGDLADPGRQQALASRGQCGGGAVVDADGAGGACGRRWSAA